MRSQDTRSSIMASEDIRSKDKRSPVMTLQDLRSEDNESPRIRSSHKDKGSPDTRLYKDQSSNEQFHEDGLADQTSCANQMLDERGHEDDTGPLHSSVGLPYTLKKDLSDKVKWSIKSLAVRETNSKTTATETCSNDNDHETRTVAHGKGTEPITSNRSMHTQTDEVYPYKPKWHRIIHDEPDFNVMKPEPHSTTLLSSDDSSSCDDNDDDGHEGSPRLKPEEIFAQIRRIKEKIKANMGSRFSRLQSDTEALLNVSGDIVRQIRMKRPHDTTPPAVLDNTTRCHLGRKSETTPPQAISHIKRQRETTPPHTSAHDSPHLVWQGANEAEKPTKIRCTKVWTPPSDSERSHSENSTQCVKRPKILLNETAYDTPVKRGDPYHDNRTSEDQSLELGSRLRERCSTGEEDRSYAYSRENLANSSTPTLPKPLPLKRHRIAETGFFNVCKTTQQQQSQKGLLIYTDFQSDSKMKDMAVVNQSLTSGHCTTKLEDNANLQTTMPVVDHRKTTGTVLQSATENLQENTCNNKEPGIPPSDYKNHFTYMNMGGSPWIQNITMPMDYESVVYDLSISSQKSPHGSNDEKSAKASELSYNTKLGTIPNNLWSLYSSQYYYQCYSQYYAACYYNNLSAVAPHTNSAGPVNVSSEDALDLSSATCQDKLVLDLSVKNKPVTSGMQLRAHVQRIACKTTPSRQVSNSDRTKHNNQSQPSSSPLQTPAFSRPHGESKPASCGAVNSQRQPVRKPNHMNKRQDTTQMTARTSEVDGSDHKSDPTRAAKLTSHSVVSPAPVADKASHPNVTHVNDSYTAATSAVRTPHYDYSYYASYGLYGYPAYIDMSLQNTEDNNPLDLSKDSPKVLNLSKGDDESVKKLHNSDNKPQSKDWYSKPTPGASTSQQSPSKTTAASRKDNQHSTQHVLQHENYVTHHNLRSSSNKSQQSTPHAGTTAQHCGDNDDDGRSTSPYSQLEIDYHELVNQLKEEFRVNQVHQGEFARRVLHKSQGYMSDLLQQAEKLGYKPKSIAKQNFVLLYRWMNVTQEQRQQQYESWNNERQGLSKGPCGRKKITKRTFITSEQKKIMDTWYRQYNMYPRREERLAIADSLELPEEVIKNYFKNKRQRKE